MVQTNLRGRGRFLAFAFHSNDLDPDRSRRTFANDLHHHYREYPRAFFQSLSFAFTARKEDFPLG